MSVDGVFRFPNGAAVLSIPGEIAFRGLRHACRLYENAIVGFRLICECPDAVVGFFTAIAEDLRRELASVGARSIGEIVGESRRLLRPLPTARAELSPVIGAGPWPASAARRANPGSAGRDVRRTPASSLEAAIAAAFRGQGSVTAAGLRVTTADRSFGASLTGALERGELHGPIRLELCISRRYPSG